MPIKVSDRVSPLLNHLPLIAIVLLVLCLHIDMLIWAVPATGDHMIHLYKGWHMAEQMLPSGRLTGWSNMAFAGYPAGVYYPVLGDLLISAFRYGTFGLISWERVYGLSFLFLLVAMPLSVYAVTRRAVGPAGSLIAAVLAVGDVGDWPQGGHHTTAYWGVWPFMLGVTLTMFTMRLFEGVLERPIRTNPLYFPSFAAVLSLTVLAHPMTVFFLCITLPLFFVLFSLKRRHGSKCLPALFRALLSSAIAALMALFWVVPWITGGGRWTFGWPAVGFGGQWLSLLEMVSALVQNELFKNFYWISWLLGIAGLFVGLASGRRWPAFIYLLFIALFFFAGLCYDVGGDVVLRKVQIERSAAFMKFIWFALAGVAADRAGKACLGLVAKAPAKWKTARFQTAEGYVRASSGYLFAGVLIAAGWYSSYGKVAITGYLGGEIWEDIVRAERWLSEQPRGDLDRVLYQPGELCIDGNLGSDICNEVYHRHIFASGPVRTNLPKLRFGYEATAIFKNLPLRHRWPLDTMLIKKYLTDSRALSNLNVRWIVSLENWAPRPDIEKVKRFGSVFVYSVDSGEGPPVRLDGTGRLDLIEFSDEFIAVRVEGARPGSWIRFPIANFYPWRAYRNGEPIEISNHGVLPGIRRMLISAPALDGVTELRYERPWYERLANWTSLATWALWLLSISLLVVFGRRGGGLVLRRCFTRGSRTTSPC